MSVVDNLYFAVFTLAKSEIDFGKALGNNLGKYEKERVQKNTESHCCDNITDTFKAIVSTYESDKSNFYDYLYQTEYEIPQKQYKKN